MKNNAFRRLLAMAAALFGGAGHADVDRRMRLVVRR